MFRFTIGFVAAIFVLLYLKRRHEQAGGNGMDNLFYDLLDFCGRRLKKRHFAILAFGLLGVFLVIGIFDAVNTSFTFFGHFIPQGEPKQIKTIQTGNSAQDSLPSEFMSDIESDSASAPPRADKDVCQSFEVDIFNGTDADWILNARYGQYDVTETVKALVVADNEFGNSVEFRIEGDMYENALGVSNFNIPNADDRVLTVRYMKKDGKIYETLKKQTDGALHIFFEQ